MKKYNVSHTASFINYEEKFIRDSIREIQRNLYITVIGKTQQRIIEEELSILDIKYRTTVYSADIVMYIKEEL